MSILLHLARGRPAAQVADSLHVARTTVDRMAERLRSDGFAGLADRREDNGRPGVDELFLLLLRQVVAGSPQDYGWARPTGRQELLCRVMKQQTGRLVSPPPPSHCLKTSGARLGRPRATIVRFERTAPGRSWFNGALGINYRRGTGRRTGCVAFSAIGPAALSRKAAKNGRPAACGVCSAVFRPRRWR